MKMRSYIFLCLLPVLLSACQGTQLPPASVCATTGDDSQGSGSGIISVIDSASVGSPTHHTFTSPRLSPSNQPVTLEYMIHGHANTKALLVLIAGGQLAAGLEGDGAGGLVTAAGGNFLVRSAHLFAQQGYKVVSIDQPGDAAEYILGDDAGWALDPYRISVAHAVDLSAIINDANSTNLPVLIAGTSRGGISAVAHSELASAIAISNPVTGGTNGHPLKHSAAANVAIPVHVLWHEQDACTVTVPVDSYTLAGAFPNGSDNGLTGGFSPSGTNLCGAYSHHGFLGMESCAVTTSTNWLDGLSLPATRPTASAITLSTSSGITIDLSTYAIAASGGILSYELPFTTLPKGGSISLSGASLSFIPASTGVETFVYLVKEANGGRSHNTIRITVTP